jgi:hypothetical protein
LEIVFLVGRLDTPTDALRDYSHNLGKELRAMGHEVILHEVRWERDGWKPALAAMRPVVRNRVAALQYSGLSWVRRRGALGALTVAREVRLAGGSFCVTIHDPLAADFGPGRRARFGAAVERRLLSYLTARSEAAFVTIEPSLIPWSPRGVHLLPTGTNIPPPALRPLSPKRKGFTVAVFCLSRQSTHSDAHDSGAGPDHVEARTVAHAFRRAAEQVDRIRLHVFGRGAMASEPVLRKVLGCYSSCLTVEGLLPAPVVSERLTKADAMLFVRSGGVSSRHGTFAAAIAHGLPVIGIKGLETGPPATEAGTILVQDGDVEGLAEGIVRLATNPSEQTRLRGLCVKAYADHFSWERIAGAFLAQLPIR